MDEGEEDIPKTQDEARTGLFDLRTKKTPLGQELRDHWEHLERKEKK